MDPEQLQIILIYSFVVSGASLALQYRNPQWTRIRIALISGGLLPFLGILLSGVSFLRWTSVPPLPHDTDHHAMAAIGIIILLILSIACLIVGIVISLLVTTIARAYDRK